MGCSEIRMKSSMLTSIFLNTFSLHTNWFSECLISLLLFMKLYKKPSSLFSFSLSSSLISSISSSLNSMSYFNVLNCLKKSKPLFLAKGLRWLGLLDWIILSDYKFLAVNVFILSSEFLGILCNGFRFYSHTFSSLDHSKVYYFLGS